MLHSGTLTITAIPMRRFAGKDLQATFCNISNMQFLNHNRSGAKKPPPRVELKQKKNDQPPFKPLENTSHLFFIPRSGGSRF